MKRYHEIRTIGNTGIKDNKWNKKMGKIVLCVCVLILLAYNNDVFLSVLENEKVQNENNLVVSDDSSSMYIAKATFYDYYSDSQVGRGSTPLNITDGTQSGTKNTFSKFNKALYNNLNYGNPAKSPARYPMYQGSFPGGNGPSDLQWLYKPNNEAHNRSTNFWLGANSDQGGAAATHGLVDSTLRKDDYGVYTLSQTNGSNTSLLPFFDKKFLTTTKFENSSLSIGAVRENVDFPFRRVVDRTDVYYEFYSREDTVRFNSSGQLDYKGRNATQQQVANASTKIGFYPYNSPSESGKGALNYGHGLKIEFPFYMTEDGKFNGEDMIFEFSGDDDVWVFVDGQLVLDLGGSHQPIGGSINFAKKESYVDNVKDNRSAFSSHSIDSYVTKYANQVYQFSNQLKSALRNTAVQHTLSFFYMERGMGGSNFNVKFNLPKQQWDLNLYPNGGVVYDASYKYNNAAGMYTKKYVIDSTVTLPTQPNGIDREGYDFAGWYTNSDFSGDKVTQIVPGDSGNKNFYAKWVPKRYKIILHTNNATVIDTKIDNGIINSYGDIVGTYTYGKGAVFPKANADILKENGIFAGWYDNPQGAGNMVTGIPASTGPGAPMGDKEYWARWVTIDFVKNGNNSMEFFNDKQVMYLYNMNKHRPYIRGATTGMYDPLSEQTRYFSFDIKASNMGNVPRRVSVWLSSMEDGTNKASRLNWQLNTDSSYVNYSNSQRTYTINDNSRVTIKCPNNVDDYIGEQGSRHVYVFLQTETGNMGNQDVDLIRREVFVLK